MARHIAWFSCGAASAVAAKLAVDMWDDVEIVYCDTMSAEHPDNQRFFDEVQEWIGRPITVIHSEKFKDVTEVWDERSYMAGIHGAPCTTEMKKIPRYDFQRPDDIHTFGYTSDEFKRIERFETNNPELEVSWILRDKGIDKEGCYTFLDEAGVTLPVMYSLGYNNNNCLGCVKATSAKYWNMIRRDFPVVFEDRSRQSREIGARLTREKGVRIYLDELKVDYMPADSDFELPDLSCGPVCSTDEND